jgi:transketolase
MVPVPKDYSDDQSCNDEEVMDRFCVYSIRLLAGDMVDRASSGHLGAPFGCAALANALWGKIMKFSPRKKWLNRDRFVLSAGHASALQYVMLHLTGHGLGTPHDVSMDELKRFRQAGSSTPGHPEYRMTNGVEVTTGPLGQGFANAVGMAIAEAHLGARFNREGFPLFDYYTYVLAGDGCLMEGVASEAASLAGHLQLHKLIAFYDDNGITIDGSTDLAFSEDVGARFAAYNWNVVRMDTGDTYDAPAFENAVQEAKLQTERPTIIIMKTTIGSGAGPGLEGTNKAHGGKFSNLEELRKKWFSPKGLLQSNDPMDAQVADLVQSELEVLAAESPSDPIKVLPKFHVPKLVLNKFRDVGARGDRMADEWDEMVQSYMRAFRDSEPDIVADLESRLAGKYLLDGWQAKLNDYLRQEQQTIDSNLPTLFNNCEEEESCESLERRISSEAVGSTARRQKVVDVKFKHKAGRIYAHDTLKVLVENNPALIGGSPDVGSSSGGSYFSIQGMFLPPRFSSKYPGASYAGRYIHFGVREHACMAILNGIAASSCLIPYSALFTVFYQYGLPAIRMASISKFPILYIGTHDSIDVGEDGPTHQPVEVLPQLRAMPNLLVFRPANLEEMVGSFQVFAEQYETGVSIGVDPKPVVQRPVFIMTSRGELGLPYKSNTSIRGQDGVWKGAYVIHDCYDELTATVKQTLHPSRFGGALHTTMQAQVLPDIVLISSGQDVALIMKAKELLLQWSKAFNDKLSAAFKGFPVSARCARPALLKVRVVSMPCWELFDEQDQEYQDSVLLSSHKEILRIYVEKAATKNTGHDKYAHFSVLMPSFGLSGKSSDVEHQLEFTAEHVAAKVWASWMDRGRTLPQAGDEPDHGFSTWVSHLSRRPGLF